MLELFLLVELYYMSCGELFHQCMVEVQNMPVQSVHGKAEELGRGWALPFEKQRLLPDVLSCHPSHSVSGTGNQLCHITVLLKTIESED